MSVNVIGIQEKLAKIKEDKTIKLEQDKKRALDELYSYMRKYEDILDVVGIAEFKCLKKRIQKVLNLNL